MVADCPDGGREKAGALAQSIGTSEDEISLSLPAAEAAARSRIDAFGQAERHSRWVRRLKIALPVAAFAMAACFAVFSYVSTPAAIVMDNQGSNVGEGKLVMANPKLEGFTKDGRPYSMFAGRAVQDFEEQGLVNLESIDAKMPIEKDNWARVQTDSGVFNRTDNTLDVKTDITVTTDDGTVANLKSAFLDINKGTMNTSEPIRIRTKGATISAGSMSVLNNGRRIIFEKQVRMNIDPVALKAAQAAKGDKDASN